MVSTTLDDCLTVNDIAAKLKMRADYVRRTFVKEMRHFKIGATCYVHPVEFEKWLKTKQERPPTPRWTEWEKQHARVVYHKGKALIEISGEPPRKRKAEAGAAK